MRIVHTRVSESFNLNINLFFLTPIWGIVTLSLLRFMKTETQNHNNHKFKTTFPVNLEHINMYNQLFPPPS